MGSCLSAQYKYNPRKYQYTKIPTHDIDNLDKEYDIVQFDFVDKEYEIIKAPSKNTILDLRFKKI